MRGERIIVQVLTKSGFSKKVVDGPHKGRRQALDNRATGPIDPAPDDF
jgi:hypothetical protein